MCRHIPPSVGAPVAQLPALGTRATTRRRRGTICHAYEARAEALVLAHAKEASFPGLTSGAGPCQIATMRAPPTLAVAIGLAAGTALLRIPSLTEPNWYYDESLFETVAWATSKGVPMYAGVYDLQPPGIYWIYRLLLLLGAAQHHFVVQIADDCAVIAAAVLTFVIATRMTSLWPAALAGALSGLVLSVPSLDGTLLNVEIAALPFWLGGLVLALNRGALAAGLLAGAAVVIRPSFLLDSLALVVPLLSVSSLATRRLTLALLGGAAMFALALLAMWWQGSLAAYLTIVAPSDRAYLVWANGDALTPVLVRLALLGALAVASLRLASSMSGRLLALWLPASLAGASLTPLEYTHFAHEAIPPLAISAAGAAARLPRRWLAAPAAGLALLATTELALILPAQQTGLMTGKAPPPPLLSDLGFQDLPGYYANWWAFAAGQESRSRYDGWFPDEDRKRAEVTLLRGLAGNGGTRLQMLGGQPLLYVDSGLLPASRYVTTRSSFWRVESAPGDMHRDLAAGCADIVVAVAPAGTWRADLEAGAYAEVPGAPWPTFRATRPHGRCTNSS